MIVNELTQIETDASTRFFSYLRISQTWRDSHSSTFFSLALVWCRPCNTCPSFAPMEHKRIINVYTSIYIYICTCMYTCIFSEMEMSISNWLVDRSVPKANRRIFHGVTSNRIHLSSFFCSIFASIENNDRCARITTTYVSKYSVL